MELVILIISAFVMERASLYLDDVIRAVLIIFWWKPPRFPIDERRNLLLQRIISIGFDFIQALDFLVLIVVREPSAHHLLAAIVSPGISVRRPQ